MTAEVTDVVRDRADALGIEDVFSRPYSPDDVLSALAMATDAYPADALRQAA